MVKILFYTSTPNELGTEITCMLALSAENSYQFQSVYNTTKLKQLLQSEVNEPPIVILATLTHKELDELLILKQVYKDLPVVLLLSDDTEETLQKAHKFRPRFLTTIHHDFRYVLSVVEQIGKAFCNIQQVERMHEA